MELSLDDVPPTGHRIVLETKWQPARWGDSHRHDRGDSSGKRYPHAYCGARVGPHVAGIDLVTPDISQSILEVGGAIIEINEGSAFNLHLFPGAGPARDPGPAIMAMLFPPGTPLRVPVVAVTASDQSAAICREIARAVTETGRCVGVNTRRRHHRRNRLSEHRWIEPNRPPHHPEQSKCRDCGGRGRCREHRGRISRTRIRPVRCRGRDSSFRPANAAWGARRNCPVALARYWWSCLAERRRTLVGGAGCRTSPTGCLLRAQPQQRAIATTFDRFLSSVLAPVGDQREFSPRIGHTWRKTPSMPIYFPPAYHMMRASQN